MIDVDHFKQFNDTHGHILGDQALIAITRALNTALVTTRGNARPGPKLCMRPSGRSRGESPRIASLKF